MHTIANTDHWSRKSGGNKKKQPISDASREPACPSGVGFSTPTTSVLYERSHFEHLLGNKFLAALIQSMPGVYYTVTVDLEQGLASMDAFGAALKLDGDYVEDEDWGEGDMAQLQGRDEEADLFCDFFSVPGMIEKRDHKLMFVEKNADMVDA